MPEDPRPLSHIMGINRRNLELIFPHNPRRGFPMVDNKIRTKELLRRHRYRYSKDTAGG